jgi:two-component system sporulation sensor kinase B
VFLNGLEALLLNVLFLIVFLLFIPILLELNTYSFFNKKKKWILTFSSMLAIICCISFPFEIMDGYIFDLRLVALTVGGLYGGVPAILFLGVTTILIRFVFGGSGALATLIVVSILSLCLVSGTNFFHHSSRKKKIMVGSFISVFAVLLALLNSVLFFEASFSLLFLFLYVIITICTTSLIIYLYEVFHDNILIHKRVIRAEKMEVVSHLASSISHEVRNPLTTVKGFLQLMLQSDLPVHKRKEFLEIAINEIDRANEIIRDYLTFAKPSPENCKILSMQEELHRTIQIISPFANMNGVEIVKDVKDYSFKGEVQLFQQCLINIFKNCIEAMPNTGKLNIESKEENGKLLLTISDNGKGMTKEQLARVGEPYFTTKGREGTGLGMMVSIRIIESMNGKLSVTSKLNEGTNFYIRLPIVSE